MLGTKSKTFIIGWVAALLGFIMNVIYNVQSAIGIGNIGLCIILFTIVIYLLMTPLTIQQQKFSKLSAKMNPELQAVQAKYKGKNGDQAAMAKMNEETQAIYAKYGVNPMGSCLQLAIQMPILFALYRVIWNIPAYVDKVRTAFVPLTTALMSTSGAEDFLKEAASKVAVSFPSMTDLTTIDVLYKFKPENWTALREAFPDLSSVIDSTQKSVDSMNYFLGLNIADSPANIILESFRNKAFLMLIAALMVPVLAAVTQWVNAKLMTSATEGAASAQADSTAQTMKMMNNVMPVMSAVFCLTLPVGLGIYWIAGAVVRSVQQVVINKRLDNMDLDEIVKANLEKMNKKREKAGLPPQKMTNNARQTTRNIEVAQRGLKPSPRTDLPKEKAEEGGGSQAADTAKVKAKPGSLASKAMLVQEYNETHGKK